MKYLATICLIAGLTFTSFYSRSQEVFWDSTFVIDDNFPSFSKLFWLESLSKVTIVLTSESPAGSTILVESNANDPASWTYPIVDIQDPDYIKSGQPVTLTANPSSHNFFFSRGANAQSNNSYQVRLTALK